MTETSNTSDDYTGPVTIGPVNVKPIGIPVTSTPVITVNAVSNIYPPWNYINRGSSTKVLVISSKKTGQLRRVIQTDNDLEYEHFENQCHEGENIYYMSIPEYEKYENNLKAFKDHVAQHHNFENAPDDDISRLVHVDHIGNVVNIIHGDLTCGDHVDWHGKDHSLHHHKDAQIGWKYSKGKFHKHDEDKK